MKKGMPWASPSLDAWVSLNMVGMNHGGIPKLRLFTLLDHIISSSSLDPWKLPSHQTSSKLIRGLVHNQKFTCSEVTQSFLTLLDIAQSYWTLMDQRNSSNIAKEAMRNKRQNLSKTEQSVKTNLEGALNLLKRKNSKLMKVAYISEDHAWFFLEFFNFYGVCTAQNSKNLSLRRDPNLASTFY